MRPDVPLLSAALFLAAALPLSPLDTTMPQGFPTAETLSGWERIRGQGEGEPGYVAYEFHVNPARPGLYELTRYRIHPRARQGQPAAVLTEKILWNSDPGRAPLRCYELVGDQWRALTPGSDRYREEMFTAIGVYFLHRRGMGID
jgi:hypothetical protein